MNPDEIIGTWKLVGYHNRTVDGRELPQSYGPEFLGLFQFHPNGRVILIIADGRVELPASLTERPFSAYSGSWTFDGKKVSNTVDVAYLPGFAGTTLTRDAVYKDGRLSLFPPPIEIDGELNYRELIWEKII
jgi:hypothetical protein